MDQAHRRTRATIAALSDRYFASGFARSEAWARLAQDPVGKDDRLIPFRVGTITDPGLLGHFAYTDLTDCDAAEAERRLSARVKSGRRKPTTRPGFPGAPKRRVAARPRFPAAVHN